MVSSQIKLLDVVALVADLPQYNLWRGQIGTVVETLADGDAFEVEFSDHTGRTYESLGLRPEQIMVLDFEPRPLAPKKDPFIQMKEPDSGYEAKDKAFYSAMVAAWLNTKIEKDKQLLGISVTAIGLLVTLLRTVGASTYLQICFFGFSLLAFLIAIISILFIFDRNAIHLEKVLEETETEDKILSRLDKISVSSFVVGIIFLIIIGISSAELELIQPVNMSSENQSKSTSEQINSYSQKVGNGSEHNSSFSGVSNLRPKPPKPKGNESQGSNSSNNSENQKPSNES